MRIWRNLCRALPGAEKARLKLRSGRFCTAKREPQAVSRARMPKNLIIYADMAELADAHGSGPCESNFMGVQVSQGAP